MLLAGTVAVTMFVLNAVPVCLSKSGNNSLGCDDVLLTYVICPLVQANTR